jgi:FkbM family methyltransferase
MSGYGWEQADSGTPEHNWEKYYELKEGDVYVEAGAFWARYGKIASRKVGSQGKVILIEPSPMNVLTIRDVIKHYDLKNVTVVEKAVGLGKQNRKLLIGDNPSGPHLVTDDYVSPATIQVDMDTVPNILAELGIDRVDLFAGDVEGEEVWMVMPMRNELLRTQKVRHVAVAAYHKSGNADALICMLETNHYKGAKYEDGVVYAHI